MRFMILVKATKESEAGVMPTQEQLAEMGKFNEELVKAGVMLAGEGLQHQDGHSHLLALAVAVVGGVRVGRSGLAPDVDEAPACLRLLRDLERLPPAERDGLRLPVAQVERHVGVRAIARGPGQMEGEHGGVTRRLRPLRDRDGRRGRWR